LKGRTARGQLQRITHIGLQRTDALIDHRPYDTPGLIG
jgi:hypothetical protein